MGTGHSPLGGFTSLRPLQRQRRVLLLGMAAAGLAACGGGGGDGDAPAPAPAPGASEPPASGGTSAFSVCALGEGAALHGARAFPADNPWNTDISGASVDPASDTLLASIGLSTALHPDFGAGLYEGAPIGIPYTVVAGTQAAVAVHFTAWGDESDPGPYPVPALAPVEGGSASTGDRHVLVIDRDHDRLYELAGAYPNPDGSWNAACGAVFDLGSNTVRPGGQPGWTSADAAGLPIFPGLSLIHI